MPEFGQSLFGIIFRSCRNIPMPEEDRSLSGFLFFDLVEMPRCVKRTGLCGG